MQYADRATGNWHAGLDLSFSHVIAFLSTPPHVVGVFLCRERGIDGGGGKTGRLLALSPALPDLCGRDYSTNVGAALHL